MEFTPVLAAIVGYAAPVSSTILWIAVSCGLLLFTTAVYMAVTPYNEIVMIRNGNVAAALALSGALVGLALPLVSVVLHAHKLADMIVWSGIGLVVQLVAFLLMSAVFLPGFRAEMDKGNTAAGGLLGAFALVVGMMTAVCLVP
jgi:putative membrane protein